MDKSGEFIPIRLAPKTPSGRTGAGPGEIAQGRFIVHPAVREEIIHEGMFLTPPPLSLPPLLSPPSRNKY